MQYRKLWSVSASLAVLLAAACGSDDNGTADNGTSSASSAPTSVAPTAAASSTPDPSSAPDAPSASDGDTSATAGDGEEIFIGAAVAKTGFMAAFDVPALATLEIAVDQINEAGGIDGHPVRIESIDTKTDRAESANAATALIDQGADLIVTTCDFDFGGPAALVADDAGLVAIAPCSSEVKFGPAGLGDLSFSMGTPNITEGAVMAKFAIEEQGWENIYVLTDDSIEYTKGMCRSFIDRFEELGGTVAGEDLFIQGDASVASQVSRINALSTPPDAVVLCSYPPGGATAVLQLRQGGIDVPLLTGFGMDGSYWLEAIPDLSDFYVLTLASIFGDDPNPEVQELAAAYKEKTGGPPPTGAFVTGAAVLDALEQAYTVAGTTEGSELAAALETFNGELTIVGPTTFNDEVHISLDRPMLVLEVQNGQHKYLTTVQPENVDELIR